MKNILGTLFSTKRLFTTDTAYKHAEHSRENKQLQWSMMGIYWWRCCTTNC